MADEQKGAISANMVFYSNDAEIKVTNYDFRLIFWENSFSGRQEDRHHLCSICMSPQHYKMLVQIMQGQLQTYEANIGEIALGPMGIKQAAPAKEEGTARSK